MKAIPAKVFGKWGSAVAAGYGGTRWYGGGRTDPAKGFFLLPKFRTHPCLINSIRWVKARFTAAFLTSLRLPVKWLVSVWIFPFM